jgi:hypothetical protein
LNPTQKEPNSIILVKNEIAQQSCLKVFDKIIEQISSKIKNIDIKKYIRIKVGKINDLTLSKTGSAMRCRHPALAIKKTLVLQLLLQPIL